MLKLRPYQEKLITDLKQQLLQGKRKVCCVLGCGGGKSIIQGNIAKMTTDKGNRVIFMVHRKELCDQITKTFKKCDVNFDLCSINMVQTLTRHINEIEQPSVIIVDEAHHILSNSYMRILEAFPDAIVVGMSATPVRMNEGGLGKVFQALVEGVSTRWLIDNRYLADYKYYGVELADASKLHTKNGDFDKQEVETLMNRSYVFGGAVENWKKYANGKQTIIYCSSIACSKSVVEQFKAEGIQAYHLDATTPQKEREKVVEGFRKGIIKVLSNVDLFGEGFDVPDCEAVVLLRPTKSLSLHIQQSMRSMRSDGKLPEGRNKDKVAIILDHVGNFTRHGLPDDFREWTLEGRKKREKTKVNVKQCKVCFSVAPASAKVCPCCGAEFSSDKPKTSDKNIEGVLLREIARKPFEAYKECKTWDELELFRKAKKYRFAWSIHKAKELNIAIPSKYYAMCYRMGYRI